MTKNKVFFAFLVSFTILIITLLQPITGLVASQKSIMSGYVMDEYSVTSGGSVYIDPANINTLQFPTTDGDYIVWTDSMSGNGYDDDIYYLDLATWTTHNITHEYNLDASFIGNQRWPIISNGVIVWMDDANAGANFEIWSLDLNDVTPTPIMISDGNPASVKMFPYVDGNHAVWMQSVTSFDIFLYDFSTTATTNLTNNLSHQLYPKVSGDYIVWQEDLGGVSITLYEISTSTTSTIVGGPNNKSWPCINGNSLVWMDNDGTSDNIYYISDVTAPSPVQVPIANTTETEAVPFIDGNIIVWNQWSSADGEWDFYIHDLSRGLTSTVDRSADRGAITIYGNMLVWLDRQDTPASNYADVHMGILDWDDTPPIFMNLPDTEMQINLVDNQVLDSNIPYNIMVLPEDLYGVETVRFFFDGGLICTDDSPSVEGLYECLWQIPNRCGDVRVEAEDFADNTSSISRMNICSALASTGSAADIPSYIGATLILGAGISFLTPYVIPDRTKIATKI